MLATATNEAQRSGECAEVLKALTGDNIFCSSFFDGSEIPPTPAVIESEAQFLRDHPAGITEIRDLKRFRESERHKLYEWFRQPPCSIEWMPNSEEAKQKAVRHFQSAGMGPWMIEFSPES